MTFYMFCFAKLNNKILIVMTFYMFCFEKLNGLKICTAGHGSED